MDSTMACGMESWRSLQGESGGWSMHARSRLLYPSPEKAWAAKYADVIAESGMSRSVPSGDRGFGFQGNGCGYVEFPENGNSTYPHPFPWKPKPWSPDGTDRLMLG